MIANKKLFFKGAALLAAFLVVLVIMFIPMFDEGNTLNYMDNLYNSISKGSAYYIPKVMEGNAAFKGKAITVELILASETQVKQTTPLFETAGATVVQTGQKLAVSGDLGAILGNCLSDSDVMFANNGEAVKSKYGYGEKVAMFNWWTALKKMDAALKKQELFPEAKLVAEVNKKSVECAYNYYQIEPKKITEKLGIVIFSLVFYVVYTLWFGFSIMFMFEGWGMKLEH